MISRDQLLDMPPGEPVVFLAGGDMGLLIGWPPEGQHEARVQVFGEPEARRIDIGTLTRAGNALVQDGAVLPLDGETFESWMKRSKSARG